MDLASYVVGSWLGMLPGRHERHVSVCVPRQRGCATSALHTSACASQLWQPAVQLLVGVMHAEWALMAGGSLAAALGAPVPEDEIALGQSDWHGLVEHSIVACLLQARLLTWQRAPTANSCSRAAEGWRG